MDAAREWGQPRHLQLGGCPPLSRGNYPAGRGHGNPEGIAISSKHTLALTNRGAGTTAELVALAREIAAGVHSYVFTYAIGA